MILSFYTGVVLAGVYPQGMKLVATWCREDRGLGIGLPVSRISVNWDICGSSMSCGHGSRFLDCRSRDGRMESAGRTYGWRDTLGNDCISEVCSLRLYGKPGRRRHLHIGGLELNLIHEAEVPRSHRWLPNSRCCLLSSRYRYYYRFTKSAPASCLPRGRI